MADLIYERAFFTDLLQTNNTQMKASSTHAKSKTQAKASPSHAKKTKTRTKVSSSHAKNKKSSESFI